MFLCFTIWVGKICCAVDVAKEIYSSEVFIMDGLNEKGM